MVMSEKKGGDLIALGVGCLGTAAIAVCVALIVLLARSCR